MLRTEQDNLAETAKRESILEVKRFDNVVAIRTKSGRVIGFHTENLQVAALDQNIWKALDGDDTPEAEESWSEIREWNAERDLEVTDGHLEQKIRVLTINVTQICNLKCTYCAAGGDGTYGSNVKKIDLGRLAPQIEMLLKAVPNNGRFVISFLGGEPLIYPEALQAIADYSRSLAQPRGINLRFAMTTNGTLVTPEIAEMLANLECHINVSLDGPAEVNDLHRPTPGGRASTAQTLKGVAELFKVKDRLGALSVHSVFGSHNTQVLKTYLFLREFAWDDMSFTYASGPEDAVYSPQFVEELALVADEAYAFGGETELKRITTFKHYFQILDSQKRMHNYCGAGKSSIQVDTSGKFYACNWFIGDKKEELGQGVELDWKKLAAYADPLVEKNKCGDCWAKFMCGGGCMFVHRDRTGDKHQRDTEFCTRTKTIIAKGIELYEKSRSQIEGSPSETH